ncbi:TRAP transporter fused permease subunit [Roseinatronobacter alkalisoli]|uniref:TRAP transporter fused permease subunit n=1 Tax=Roseinatronobacter alkalisoli TaxID=3028235 RepID=A0ABT5TAL6_9RHOB|nr:TRAP transporter fused permease subunit [Roseinatronobacter sp. HJB301]MDD7972161.1 TRAP transporter fused permease subunit [Roseinatronobacter sp. HJB301]
MANSSQNAAAQERPLLARACYLLAFAFIVIGLFNAMPGIPGLDQAIRSVTGLPWISIRRFPYEYFYPIAFVVMMLIVALNQACKRQAAEGSRGNTLHYAFDALLVVVTIIISLSYLSEISAVCVIDQITGDRARMIARSLEIERENALLLGLPAPSTVDNPRCLNTLGPWLVPVVGFAIAVFLAYTVKVWGLPLVLVAILVVAWSFLTIAIWYFYGDTGINKYLVTRLGSEPRTLADGYSRVQGILTNNASGLLGRFMSIILNDIFPYLILGALFGISAGGQSLLKLAMRVTRNLRGGPAHAAVVSSALFGTISGGPIVNVLSTGRLTIPMMLQRGFSRVFAGGVEAAASSGGTIMPPVMGVAAFVLASMAAVPYADVIKAAVIPALAFFICLFLTVVFQARKQGIQAVGGFSEDMRMTRQDKLNLVMIFAPISLITVLLLTSKESIGCGWLGTLFGVEQAMSNTGCIGRNLPWGFQLIQNAAGDVGGAGWWAVMLLMGLLFLDPTVRKTPRKLVDALAEAGTLIATLYLMFLVVTIIDFCLKLTGMPFYLSVDVLQWLNSMNLGEAGAGVFQFVALIATMLLAILLGMGMPAAPAFINVSLLMGPVLVGLGLSTFTANMFIFYFAAASAITPPVALAAYAAASITKADPIMTSFAALRAGVMMFVVPFIFAFYPELLLIPQAVIDPSASGATIFLPGHDGQIHWPHLIALMARLLVALYLLASALARYDLARLAPWQVVLRIVIAIGIFMYDPLIYSVATVLGLVVIGAHVLVARRKKVAETLSAGGASDPA